MEGKEKNQELLNGTESKSFPYKRAMVSFNEVTLLPDISANGAISVLEIKLV